MRAVDPVEPKKVMKTIEDEKKHFPNLRVSHLLTTHHHKYNFQPYSRFQIPILNLVCLMFFAGIIPAEMKKW